jgi:hypothetical protein
MVLIPSRPQKNKITGNWEVYLTSPDGSHQELQLFGGSNGQKDAYSWIKQYKNKDSRSPAVVEKTNLKKESSFLESYITQSFDDGISDPFDDAISDEEKIAEFNDDFDKKELEAKNKAQQLLNSVAKLYVKADKISSSDYLKFKLDIETQSLSSLLFQLDISKKALRKLSQEIHTGNSSPRMYEVLTGLQRVSLDISKYIQDYMGTIEKSMKQMEIEESGGDVNDGDVSIGGGGNLRYNNRSTLILEIKQIVQESRMEVPLSKNPRLSNVEVEEIKIVDDNMESGLETF